MKETWRWFGPLDKIGLDEIRQTGASGIVTALHDIPYGEVWQRKDIAARRDLIAASGMSWDVVESLPVHEDIKRGSGDLNHLFGAYRQSMANLAAEGVTTICYNFMPLLDWTRTTLTAPVPGGGTALRFDMTEYAAFDLFLLGREQESFPDAVTAGAEAWYAEADDATRSRLTHAIMAGLPGAYARYDAPGLRQALLPWQGFTADDLRASLKRFLSEVMPTADELGLRMCVHPDDPPRPLFGLPRIVSCQADIRFLVDAYDSPANGLTLCSGSLGAHPDNDVVEIAQTFAPRIHFAHLRNVHKEPDGSFQETAHLDGDVDMGALMSVLLTEQARRTNAGRIDDTIPFRPDHGHELVSDLGRGTHPGYPLVGRLKGLAELRGLMAGLRHGARR